MLPFGLKVAWFILSVIGFFVCWVVLWAFARSAKIKWGPTIYGIGNSFLQVPFFLGMIYRMDPFQMPKSFCIAQTVLISTGSYVIAGVALALAAASHMTVVKPKTWGEGVRGLRWKNIYALPVFAFPIIATAIHTALVVHLDSTQPTDDLHCDSTSPEWVRIVGYAGLPIVLLLPSLYLSINSIYRITKTNKHLQRSRPEGEQFTTMHRASRRYDTVTFATPEGRSAHASSSSSGGAQIPSPITISSPSVQMKKFRPFRSSPSTQALERMQMESAFTSKDIDDADSQISFTFPTFANPDADRTSVHVRKEPRDSETVEISVVVKEKEATENGVWEDQASTDGPLDTEQADSIRWEDAKLSPPDSDETESMADRYVLNLADPFSSPKRKAKRPIPILSPAIWRIIMFQCAFICIQSLASVTTIVDLCKHRRVPLAFGSQHVALIMASWGPIFIFGPLPSVRRNLLPWRPIT